MTSVPFSPTAETFLSDDEIEESMQRVNRRIRDVDEFEEATYSARLDSYRNVKYENGKQWTDYEVKKLKKRRQPVVTFNKIAKAVNSLRGQEVRTRIDPKARPRGLSGFHEDDANAATDSIRYVTDAEKFDRKRSKVFHDILVPGYGGCLVELKVKKGKPQIGPNGEVNGAAKNDVRIKLRYVKWDRLFYDPYSEDPNFEDARYKGIITWMDVDEAIDFYGEDAREIIEQTAAEGKGSDYEITDDRPRGWWDSKRQRLKVIEEYYLDYDRETKTTTWKVIHFTKKGELRAPVETPIFDEDDMSVCPLAMVSGNVDEDNCRFGWVNDLISPQDEVNKRRSKLLNEVNTNKIVAEDGAFKDKQQALESYSKPSSITTVNKGFLQKGAVVFEHGQDVAQGNLQLLQDAYAQFAAIGPDLSQISELPNSLSGRAILARTNAAMIELESIFDNLRAWQNELFTLIWYAIRTYWTEEKWIRVTDDAEQIGYRFVGLNRRISKAERVQELLKKGTSLPDALTAVNATLTRFQLPIIEQGVQQALMQNPQMQQLAQQNPQAAQQRLQEIVVQETLKAQELQVPMTANDVAKLDVDIVLDVMPDTSVLQQEEFEKVAEVLPAVLGHLPPEVASKLGPLLFRMIVQLSEMRQKKLVLNELEQAMAPDPQAQEQAQQQAAFNAQQMQLTIQKMAMQLQEMEAKIGKIESETEENRADAILRLAQAQHVGNESDGTKSTR